jgi:hypothetical protein
MTDIVYGEENDSTVANKDVTGVKQVTTGKTRDQESLSGNGPVSKKPTVYPQILPPSTGTSTLSTIDSRTTQQRENAKQLAEQNPMLAIDNLVQELVNGKVKNMQEFNNRVSEIFPKEVLEGFQALMEEANEIHSTVYDSVKTSEDIAISEKPIVVSKDGEELSSERKLMYAILYTVEAMCVNNPGIAYNNFIIFLDLPKLDDTYSLSQSPGARINAFHQEFKDFRESLSDENMKKEDGKKQTTADELLDALQKLLSNETKTEETKARIELVQEYKEVSKALRFGFTNDFVVEACCSNTDLTTKLNSDATLRKFKPDEKTNMFLVGTDANITTFISSLISTFQEHRSDLHSVGENATATQKIARAYHQWQETKGNSTIKFHKIII